MMVTKTIIITERQEQFIQKHKNFNFSAWIREMLEDYIKMIGGLRILENGVKEIE